MKAPARTKAPALEAGPAADWLALPPSERVERAAGMIRERWGSAAALIVATGNVVIDACYGGDERAALDEKADANDLYRQLVRRLGGLKGGPNRKTLSLARRVAAATKQVNGHFWDVVPFGFKSELVRLPEPQLMASGAKLAVEFGWHEPQLEHWVDAELAKLGKKKKRRGQTLRRTRSAFTLTATAGAAASAQRIAQEYEQLDGKGRGEVRRELEKAREALVELERRFKTIDRGG